MHALSVRREEISVVAGKAAARRDKMSPRRTEWTKWIRLCLAEVLYDWQAYADQTKAVKGQNSKTLVTAGTIKRPLPCPVEGRKNRGFSRHRKKNRVRRKEKRLERKEKKKERKLRKKGES